VTSAATKKQYDVIVVGSGAAGGQTAYTLSMEGVKVLMLEAGRNYVPEQETPMFQTPDQAPLRGASTPERSSDSTTPRSTAGWTVPGEPYVQSTDDPHGRSPGGARACSAAGPTTGAASRCATGPTISNPIRGTA